MALLAESLVEEWLNRNGFFTIRGVKLGVNEMDLLAVQKETNSRLIVKRENRGLEALP